MGVHEAGDAILAEFDSVVAAVSCAVTFQRAMAGRNGELSDNERLEFRIGINLGEVIHDRNDIYGDGVNIAARLESLAEVGNICISHQVYEQVQGKLELGYADIGEQRVKNITTPVRAYRLLLDPAYAIYSKAALVVTATRYA